MNLFNCFLIAHMMLWWETWIHAFLQNIVSFRSRICFCFNPWLHEAEAGVGTGERGNIEALKVGSVKEVCTYIMKII